MFIFFWLTVLIYLHSGIVFKELFSKDVPQIDSSTNVNHTSAVKQTYARESNMGENFPFLATFSRPVDLKLCHSKIILGWEAS